MERELVLHFEGAQFVDGQRQRLLHQAADLKTPAVEAAFSQVAVFLVPRWTAVRPRVRGDVVR